MTPSGPSPSASWCGSIISPPAFLVAVLTPMARSVFVSYCGGGRSGEAGRCGVVSLHLSGKERTMAAMIERARNLRERVAQRRAGRRKTRAERSERRATVGDRHQQFEHRDYTREWDGRR
jgi:hypothetical protein